jgi:hypothetical protein
VNFLPLILLLGLATPDAAAPAQASPEADAPRDWNQAPPGPPEDVALWNGLKDAETSAMLHLARIGQASFRIRYGRYDELLDELARTAPPARAEEARRLRSRIEVAARQADEGVPKKGLRIRPCKYTLLHLDQRMSFPDDPALAADLPKVRAEARSCVDELAPFAAKVRPLADALETALNDADTILDREAPAPPPAQPSPVQPAAPPTRPPAAPAGATPRASPTGARS